jgi:hypothetical protein
MALQLLEQNKAQPRFTSAVRAWNAFLHHLHVRSTILGCEIRSTAGAALAAGRARTYSIPFTKIRSITYLALFLLTKFVRRATAKPLPTLQSSPARGHKTCRCKTPAAHLLSPAHAPDSGCLPKLSL